MSGKLYVGNIPDDTREGELEDKFSKYGKISSVWLARNPPGFAFVTFSDPRDAEDAMQDMNDRDFLGRRIRVELSRERRDRDRDRDRGRGRDRYDDRGGRGGGRYPRHRDYRQGEFRVIITGLPSRCSWQDLKDFLRRGGEVCYADVRDGEGVADFLTADDMDRAIRKLDGSDFDGGPVTIREDRGSRRGRDRSRSRGRRDRSRSRGRRDRSRSRDRRSRSRSGGRGRDRDEDRGRDDRDDNRGRDDRDDDRGRDDRDDDRGRDERDDDRRERDRDDKTEDKADEKDREDRE